MVELHGRHWGRTCQWGTFMPIIMQEMIPPQCHRRVKKRARSNASSALASGRERALMPHLPQLRTLQQESQEIPLSEGSLPSSSLRRWPRRAHPYGSVEEAVEGSSFELVPSLATQAPCASGIGESLDVTPIPRSNSSPILSKPIHYVAGTLDKPEPFMFLHLAPIIDFKQWNADKTKLFFHTELQSALPELPK